MTLTATKLFMNWTGATFTPTTGSPVAITRITDAKFNKSVDLEQFKGDIALFVQAIASPTQHRSIDVTSGDVATLASLAQGAIGSLTIQLGDFNNKFVATGGAISITLTTCVIGSNSADGAHGKAASAQINFTAFDATGGVTDPFVVAVL